LQEALELQHDNPERLIGEILVTLGVLTKEELIMALEMYMMTTDAVPDHVDEWLDQDEIDLLMDKIKQENKLIIPGVIAQKMQVNKKKTIKF